MFLHNYRYSLVVLLRNKGLVFWTLAFPVIMALLFHMSFAGIDDAERFSAIEVAVVDDDAYQNQVIFARAMEELSKSEDAVLHLHYADSTEAEELLNNGEVTAVISIQKREPVVRVLSSGIQETIVQSVVEEIRCDSEVISDLAKEEILAEIGEDGTDLDFERIFTDISKAVLSVKSKVNNLNQKEYSFVMIEYESLIAMTCLYSGLLSMTLMNMHQANLSAVGKRSTVAPARRGAVLAGAMCAALTVQLITLMMLYAVLLLIVKADFGNDIGKILLLSLSGSLAGLTLGAAVSVLVRTGENAKMTVLLSIVMSGCFCSGMMGIVMKNIIDKHLPFINWINPAAMITDGLYALYYYGAVDRYWFDLASILLFSVVMTAVSIGGLRRRQYDSM